MTNQDVLEKLNHTYEVIDNLTKCLFQQDNLSNNELAILDVIIEDIKYSAQVGIKRLGCDDIDDE